MLKLSPSSVYYTVLKTDILLTSRRISYNLAVDDTTALPDEYEPVLVPVMDPACDESHLAE